MRKIEFRGKTDNEESVFVYGYLRQFNDLDLAFIWDEKSHSHRVDPKTIGQYINKDYEDGTQMFEGDIVECYAEETNAVAGAFADTFRTAEVIGVIAFKDGEIGVISEGVFLINALNCAPKVEKLGNIHDNTPTNA